MKNENDQTGQDLEGTVLEFFAVQGFGYLKGKGRDELCFYAKDIRKEDGLLKKGDAVRFERYQGHGIRAVNVRKAV